MTKIVSQNFEKKKKKKCFKVTLQLNQLILSNVFSPSFQKDHTHSEWKQLQRICDTGFETIYQTSDMPNFI